MKSLVPTRGKVVILREKKGEQTTDEGIIYTEKQMDYWVRGIVAAIGEGKIYPNGRVREAEFGIGSVVIYDMRKANGYDSYDIVDLDEVVGVLSESS